MSLKCSRIRIQSNDTVGSLLSFSGYLEKCTHNELIKAQNSIDDVRDNMSIGTKGKREASP